MNQSTLILFGFLMVFTGSRAVAASTAASTAAVYGDNAIDGAVATAFALSVTYSSADGE